MIDQLTFFGVAIHHGITFELQIHIRVALVLDPYMELLLPFSHIP